MAYFSLIYCYLGAVNILCLLFDRFCLVSLSESKNEVEIFHIFICSGEIYLIWVLSFHYSCDRTCPQNYLDLVPFWWASKRKNNLLFYFFFLHILSQFWTFSVSQWGRSLHLDFQIYWSHIAYNSSSTFIILNFKIFIAIQCG